jgi:hypothetical protein
MLPGHGWAVRRGQPNRLSALLAAWGGCVATTVIKPIGQILNGGSGPKDRKNADSKMRAPLPSGWRPLVSDSQDGRADSTPGRPRGIG